MPAIPFVVLGIEGAISLYGQHQQGEAANTQANAVTHSADVQAQAQRESTAAQVKAAQDAQAFTTRVFNERMQALAPYRNAGTNAFTSLGSSLGLPADQSAAPNPAPIPLPTPAPPPVSQAPVAAARTAPRAPITQAPTNAVQPAPGGQRNTLADLGASQTASSVTMASPDGSQTQQVPLDQLDYWLSKGAKRVA